MEQYSSQKWDSRTLAICSWLINCTNEISSQILKYDVPPLDYTAQDADGGWQKVCTLFISIFERAHDI